MNDKTLKPEKTEALCTNIFKDYANIGFSINKLWAEVINIIENTGKHCRNEELQGHVCKNSKDFEVSGK